MEKTVKLSTGEEITIKPMTMRQAKQSKILSILSKLSKSVDKNGNVKDVNFFEIGINEDDIINVVKVYYPKAEELTIADALEVFSTALEVALEKKE